MTQPIAFIGEEVRLYVESDLEVESAVDVHFTVAWDDDEGRRVVGPDFDERLTLQPVAPREGARRERAFEAPWKVRLPDEVPRHTVDVVARLRLVHVDPPAGVSRVHHAHLVLTVGVVGVTRHPDLARIMRHEHFDPDSGEYDPRPLEAHLAGLTLEQRRLLFRDEPESPPHRLVVFVTLTRKDARRMGADFAPGGCVKPNASFAVFHRDRPHRRVTLVCFSRYFMVNGGVIEREPQGGKPPDEWLRRDNDRPPLWKLLVLLPYGDGTDGQVWSRIVSPEGRDVLLGNTLHGMINTHGCWMLFRNFNWPAEVYADLDRIYRTVHRPRAGRAAVERALAEVGYDVTHPPDGESSSYDKFLLYDRNFAYNWFMHDVVGVRYFSADFTYASRGLGFAKDPGRRVHDHETPGHRFAKTFPLDRVWTQPPSNRPEEGSYAYHDLDRRHAEDDAAKRPRFKVDDALLGENVLGFHTAERFVRNITGGVAKQDVEPTSWADLHLYREDDLPLSEWHVVYTEGPGLRVKVEHAADHTPVVDAEVTVRAGQLERRAHTNRNGMAHFPDLPGGPVEVQAVSGGFAPGAEKAQLTSGEQQVTLRLTPRALTLGLRYLGPIDEETALVLRGEDGSEVIRMAASAATRDAQGLHFDLSEVKPPRKLVAVLERSGAAIVPPVHLDLPALAGAKPGADPSDLLAALEHRAPGQGEA